MQSVFEDMPLRTHTIVAGGTQDPTREGERNATVQLGRIGLVYDTAMGAPAGGGLAVDPKAQTNAVGATDAAGFPVYGGPLALGYRGGWDAIRVMHHMLPDGVGRTDGTGWYSGGFPLPGLSGGTTPQCALSPGGIRIGQPAPQAQRMFVDVEGQVAAGNLISILCDRPPSTGVLEFAGLQFGFPGLQPPILLATGLEIYITSNPIVLLALVVPGQSIRFPIGNSGPGTATPLPPGPMTFSVQFLFTLSTPVPGGVVGSCGLASQELASPALWVSY